MESNCKCQIISNQTNQENLVHLPQCKINKISQKMKKKVDKVKLSEANNEH